MKLQPKIASHLWDHGEWKRHEPTTRESEVHWTEHTSATWLSKNIVTYICIVPLKQQILHTVCMLYTQFSSPMVNIERAALLLSLTIPW
jgi:hypothetical protein